MGDHSETTNDFRWTWSRYGSLVWAANSDQGSDARQSSTDRESLIPSLGAFVALRGVCRKATGEGQHLAGLAGNVHAEILRLGAREESRVRQGVPARTWQPEIAG